MKKRVLSYLLIITLILSFTMNVKAFSRSYNVKDYSYTLSDSQLEDLRDLAEDFYNKYDLEMVIVIYDYGYNEYSLETAGDRYFDAQYSNKYGVYLALDVTNAYIDDYIAVVKGSDIYYTDAEIENIYSALSGVKYNGTYAIAKKFAEKAETYVDEETYTKPKNYVPIVFGPFIIATIILLIMIKKNKMVQKATKAEAYLDKENVVFTNRQDRYITTTTSRVRINTSSGGGGSHGHTGSRGMSRGGGGRHL